VRPETVASYYEEFRAACSAPELRRDAARRRRAGATTRVAHLAVKTYRATSTVRTATLRVRVSRKLRSRLRASATSRLRLAVRPTTPGIAATVTLRVAKPR